MLPNADKIIQKLKKDGNTIHFITARLMNIKDCDTETITKESLKNFNIPKVLPNIKSYVKLKT